MAEIVRAGILAVDPGQMEAARALGMTPGKAMRRIVLPQAARVIIPPLGNEFNNMLKTTSLLFVLSVAGALVKFQTSSRTQHFVPSVRVLPRGRGLVPAADHDLGRDPGRGSSDAWPRARRARRSRRARLRGAAHRIPNPEPSGRPTRRPGTDDGPVAVEPPRRDRRRARPRRQRRRAPTSTSSSATTRCSRASR